MLTEKQVADVQSSFMKVVPRADPMAAAFYDRLFEVEPKYRDLFPEDMSDQRGKLISTLATVVQSLHDLDAVIEQVRALGERHVGYNVKAVDYGPVGGALIHALKNTIADDWDEDIEGAWAAAYAVLAREMIDAADYSVAAE